MTSEEQPNQGEPGGGGPGPAAEPPGEGAVVDVERLVRDIQRRAEAIRARGDRDRRLLEMPFDLDLDGGPGVRAGRVRLRPELGYSSKPVVGKPITLAKRVAEKLVHHVVQDALDQTSLQLEHLARAVDDVERRSEERADALAADARSRAERLGRRINERAEETALLAQRLEELRAEVARLAERVERLERGSGGAGGG